ncbi:MAG: hypothetical protein NC548_31370 [Lachnospiraceae bacterium]|nr:hypothetical protein [Lachnospiraceae bacterium]
MKTICLLLISIVLIICSTILINNYLYYCSKLGVKMFKNPKYEERIIELEEKVKKLEKFCSNGHDV